MLRHLYASPYKQLDSPGTSALCCVFLFSWFFVSLVLLLLLLFSIYLLKKSREREIQSIWYPHWNNQMSQLKDERVLH